MLQFGHANVFPLLLVELFLDLGQGQRRPLQSNVRTIKRVRTITFVETLEKGKNGIKALINHLQRRIDECRGTYQFQLLQRRQSKHLARKIAKVCTLGCKQSLQRVQPNHTSFNSFSSTPPISCGRYSRRLLLISRVCKSERRPIETGNCTRRFLDTSRISSLSHLPILGGRCVSLLLPRWTCLR